LRTDTVSPPIWGAFSRRKIGKLPEKWEAGVLECEYEYERCFQAQIVAAMPHWLTALVNIAGAATLLLICRL
jgi:hypothetical protein